ncbi:hypothetical protein Ndes2526B_g02319 [Nannochloris sp. 'desiccata']|nr:hypothetical protein NADE_007890 [Chlorella desiccata (nom. nud.)]
MAPRRRNASAKQPAQDSRDPVENAAKGKLENRRKKDQISDEEGEDLSGASFYLKQYGGLVMSTMACIGTVLCYQQEDDLSTLKTLSWCMLALIGLLLHEFRPYQRPMS